MSFIASKFAKHFTYSARSASSLVSGAQWGSKRWNSTYRFEEDSDGGGKTYSFGQDNDGGGKIEDGEVHENIIPEKREMSPQGVDPKRGWNFRGVHKGIICGKIRQTPVQKLLRNGKTLTIFNVGTGGMWDNRNMSASNSPRPAQWHRVVVHNEYLGAYAVQQLVRNSSVYVEGDIELRVYNRSVTGETVKVPEICVRYDGRIRLIKTGESTANIPFEELREGLL